MSNICHIRQCRLIDLRIRHAFLTRELISCRDQIRRRSISIEVEPAMFTVIIKFASLRGIPEEHR